MNGLSISRIEILLCLSAIVALIARRAKLPYTVGLVLAGAGIASFGYLQDVHHIRGLIYNILLPPLIFEGALYTDWKELKRNLAPILVLASLGVVISAGIIGCSVSLILGWPIGSALVFGTLIAATDPVSVIAMFKDLKIEGRIRLIVESESLINDGFAAVAFAVALACATGSHFSSMKAILLLLQEIGGGLVCGSAVALIALYFVGKTEDHLVELTISTVTAFGAFLMAMMIHSSGVVAVIIAGLIIGNLGRQQRFSGRGTDALEAFWEFAAFVSNSIIFLLIGVQEFKIHRTLIEELQIVVIGIIVVLFARAVSVYGLSTIFRGKKNEVTLSEQHILVWGGLRGALSLALVLSVPDTLPWKTQLTAAAFGVVAFSVIVQSLTVPTLLKRLKVPITPINTT